MALHLNGYSNFHDDNQDWIVSKIKSIEDTEAHTEELAEAAQNSADASQASAEASQVSAEASQASAEASQLSAEAASNSAEEAAEHEAQAKEYADNIADPVAGIVADWLEDNITPTTPIVDESLTIRGAAADAQITGNKILELNSEIERCNNGLFKKESENKFNPATAETGLLRPADGELVTSYIDYKTSDFIEVKPNDVLYMTGVKSDGTYLYGTGTISSLCLYDENKDFLNGYSNTNEFTVSNSNAKYIRFSYLLTGSFGTALCVSLTKNFKPTNVKQIVPYFDTYYLTEPLNTKIMDCWGDSRTEMIAANGTSFCDYLNALLGSEYNIVNYGLSSEASGMCSARLGSNEIFVTLENNRINATGASNITAVYVSSGLINNFFCYSTAGGVPCTIKGIKGKIYKTVYNNYSSCAFVRDNDGDQITVYPRTKVYVENENSRNHACILWWGKNDMLTAADGRNALKKIYDDAVNYIGHKKFIILGETCSLTAQYETGQILRTFVDTFNSTMQSFYPDNFIDINAWLSSEDALTSVGLTPTADDITNIAKGWPCASLMVYSSDPTDTVHPNEKGREAIANKIYSWMISKNWIVV